MKKVILYSIILMLSLSELTAQSIKIVRTDVDDSRENNVTATYLFGIDIYADEIENCNGVAFELIYNQTEYIKFSGWQDGDFGDYNKAQVVQGLTQDNKGRIIIGTGTGKALGNTGINNPKVIHLEFVVSQSAPHFSFVTFEFLLPKATVFKDGEGQKIDLESEPLTLRIHSFVEVWPGDANNDGSVTFDDYNQVNLYMGMGSSTKNLRSFKRPQASTIWKPQRVLAWDTAAVTYADCDGNGEITSTDHLIVTYNIDKTRSGGGVINKHYEFETKEFPANAIEIPVYAHSEYNYLGAAGDFILNIQPHNYLGVKAGDILSNGYIFDNYDFEKNILTVTAGNKDGENITESGVLFYIMVGESETSLNYDIIEFNAIKRNGQIFGLNSPTSVSDELNESIIIRNNNICIQDNIILNKVRIADIFGNILFESNEQKNIDLYNFSTGTYFLIINYDNKSSVKKFNIIK